MEGLWRCGGVVVGLLRSCRRVMEGRGSDDSWPSALWGVVCILSFYLSW